MRRYNRVKPVSELGRGGRRLSRMPVGRPEALVVMLAQRTPALPTPGRRRLFYLRLFSPYAPTRLFVLVNNGAHMFAVERGDDVFGMAQGVDDLELFDALAVLEEAQHRAFDDKVVEVEFR